MTLEEIYRKIDRYLLLPDKSVVKLLAAFVVGCNLPTEPPWLFLVSGSSTGKTQLVVLLEGIPGYTPVDDLTGNALMSGMKRHDTNSSLLHRLPKEGAFLVFSDFTVMLSKYKEELSKILGQLRVVFDGKMTKHTGGQVETEQWEGKAGLLAASTTTLYTKTEDYAEVGQRMVIYHMDQPDNRAVGDWKFKHSKDDRKAIRLDLQNAMREYIQAVEVPQKFEDLPNFDPETQADIIDIGHLAVTARSPVPREKFSREKEQTGDEDPEGIGRVQGQLMTLAYGLMLQNSDKKLRDSDRALLYRIGLDCIDPRRRKILQILTEYSYGGTAEQIADKLHKTKDVAERFVEDLLALGMLERGRINFGSSSKFTYSLKTEFKEIMMKFEGIKAREESLPEDNVASSGDVGPEPPLTAFEKQGSML